MTSGNMIAFHADKMGLGKRSRIDDYRNPSVGGLQTWCGSARRGQLMHMRVGVEDAMCSKT